MSSELLSAEKEILHSCLLSMTTSPDTSPELSATEHSPELEKYYADKPLMWRNIALIGLCNIGWGVVGGIVTPLVVLRLLELGLRENIQATINSANGLALAFLVMYFSWKSDHTVSRFGRRKPFLFLRFFIHSSN